MSTATARRLSVLEELFRARLRAVIDPRTTPCALTIRFEGTGIRVEGQVLNPHVATAVRNLAGEVFSGQDLNFTGLKVLSTRPASFVRVGWQPAPFFRKPEVDIPDTLTTALPGCVLRVFLKSAGFLYVQHPDGYVGYIEADLAAPVARHVYLQWRNEPCAFVSSLLTIGKDGNQLPAGCRLALRRDGRVILPDGHPAELPPGSFEVRSPADNGQRMIQALEGLLPEYTGTPYHWGGKTQVGTDCSGFVQTVAGLAGISLPRDASMQCHVGELVGVLPGFVDLLPGDIIFFMNERGFVYHVGIWLGDKRFAHSSRQFGGVVISSMAPGGEKHSPKYAEDYCYARRVGAL